MLEVRAATVASHCALLQMAEHRRKMKIVLLELLALHSIRNDSLVTAQVTNERRTWHQKASSVSTKILVDLTRILLVTSMVFPSTFINWILRPVYFPQWVSFVQYFKFADISTSIPSYVEPELKVSLSSKFMETRNRKHLVTAFGLETRQGKRKMCNSSRKDYKYVTKAALDQDVV